ncbi:MAG: hypothetical protein WA869_12080 [Alloacidobacterium sp.]|jgi:hypothetical protein
MEQSTKFRCIVTACEQQWLYQIGEQGIVYSQKQNRIAGLDVAGLLAYRAFNAGASLQDLQALGATRHASPMTADALNTIFALSKGHFPEAQEAEERRDWPSLLSPPDANVEVHGIPMLVEFSHGAEALCRDCFRSCPPATRPARFHLRLQRSTTSWTITANDQEIFPSIKDEQVGLGLLHAVRSLLYDEARYDVAFHSSMVGNREHGIMLCAPRESGKSTLAAHLAAHGFALGSDEPALLHLDTASISQVETPISLKEGTWKILRDEWPQLADAPIHVRSDGHRIKLLHPSRDRGTDAPQRLTRIVFPKYSPSSPPSLEALSPIQALALLNEGGTLFGKHFNKDKFEQYMKLICAIPAFVAQYSSLHEADQMIQKILVCDHQSRIEDH